MRAGAMDRRITLQRNTPVQGTSGAMRENWEDVSEVWAQWAPLRSDERFADQERLGFGLGTFRIRWSGTASQVNTTWRIFFAGRQYDIRDVRPVGRKETIEIDARCRSEIPLGSPSLDFSVADNSQYIALLEDV